MVWELQKNHHHMMPATAWEWIMAVIGALIGLFYAFDGWSSTSATKSLKDAPRLVNFKYAIGTFFLALIADFSKVDSAINKGRLLQVYLIWFAATMLLTIITMAIVIGYQARQQANRHPGMQFFGSSPVLHFLIYGYRSYDEKLKQAMKEWSESREQAISGFLPQYNLQVTGAILAVSHAMHAASPEQSRSTAGTILQNIEAVVRAYNREVRNLEVSANYMRVSRSAEAAEELQSATKFMHKDWSHYGHVLILEQYARDPKPALFALPVWKNAPDASEHILPGAPEAFLSGGAVLVKQGEIKFPKQLPGDIVKEINAYCERKELKCFLSMPILSSGSSCGVLNIEANHAGVFGEDEDARKKMVGMLNPFCHLLGFLIKT